MHAEQVRPEAPDASAFTGEPWNAQPGETSRSFAAFVLYRDQPQGARSLNRVVEAFYGVEADVSRASGKVRQVDAWSSANRWVDRVMLWDMHLDGIRRAATERAEADLTALMADTAYLAFGLVRRGLVRLTDAPLSARELAVLGNMASRIRATLTEADAATAGAIEDDLARLRELRNAHRNAQPQATGTDGNHSEQG